MVNYKPTVSPYKGVNFSRVDMSKLSKLSSGSQNYTNSIFSDSYKSTSGASNAANALAIGMGILSFAGVAAGIASMFKSNSGSQQSKDVQETSAATTALDAAMTKANKDGDWAPVQTECDNAETEKSVNQGKIATCQSSIDTSTKTTIPSIEGDIKDLQKANKTIDDTAIPQIKKTRDDKISQAQTAKENSITQAKANYDTVPEIPAAVKAQAKAVYDAAVKAANEQYKQTKDAVEKEYEKEKTQKEDEKKRNNTKIEKKNQDLVKEKQSVKEQTALKGQLENANKKLDSEIKEAKQKLELHLGSTKDSQKTENETKKDDKATGFNYLTRPKEQKFDSYDWMKNDPLNQKWQNQNW